MLSGKPIKFLTPLAMRRVGDNAEIVAALLEISERDALAAGCSKWSGVGEVRHPPARGADLLFEDVRIPSRQMRCLAHFFSPCSRKILRNVARALSGARQSPGVLGRTSVKER